MIDSEIIKMPSVDKAKYYTKLVNRVLYDIKPSSILDVGGGAAPFNHVTHIIDQLPWRDDIHLNGWGYAPVMKKPIYSKDTYLQRNFFDLPWPYHDKQFDFIWCTQTLEDIYDPFIICNEMERIGKQGFIQTPNVFSEVLENFWHHKWFIRWNHNRMQFLPKSGRFFYAFAEFNADKVRELRKFHDDSENVYRGVNYFWRNKINIEVLTPSSFAEYREILKEWFDEVVTQIKEGKFFDGMDYI